MAIAKRWLVAWAACAGMTIGLACHAVAQGATTPGSGGSAATTPGGAQRTSTVASNYEAPPPIRAGQPISVLFFPFGFGGEVAAGSKLGGEPLELVSHVSAAVKAGLLSSPSFSVATFSPSSALVQKGQKDNFIGPDHLRDLVSSGTGQVDAQKARTLAHRLGIQAVMIGNVEVTKSGANTVEVTLDGQLLESTTGAVIRQAAVNGAATGAADVNPVAIQSAAVNDAAHKLLAAFGLELVRPAVPAAKAAPAPKKKADTNDRREQDRIKRDSERAAREIARKTEESEQQQRSAVRKAEEAEKKRRDAAARMASKTASADAPKPARVEAPRTVAVPTETPKVAVAPVTPAEKDEVVAVVQEATRSAAPRSGAFKGVANSAGQPVPYGYALGSDKELPKRDRSGIRVPAWLGVAAFVTGFSFLL